MKKTLLTALAACLVLPFILLTGCADIDNADTNANVWIDIQGIVYNDPETGEDDVGHIDVCEFGTNAVSCTYLDELANVTFFVQHVDPLFDSGISGTSPYFDVHLDHYRVSYFRTDGGTNVPGTFDVYHDFYLPFESIIDYNVKILHADQKLDPPLIWLNSYESLGFDPETGKQIIKGYAVIQFWGKSNDGFNVYAETQLQVQFADWGDV